MLYVLLSPFRDDEGQLCYMEVMLADTGMALRRLLYPTSQTEKRLFFIATLAEQYESLSVLLSASGLL